MRRANCVVAVFLLVSLLALPVVANAWIDVNIRCNAGQNIPGDPDIPIPCTENSGRNYTESFSGESPGLLFVTLLESALLAVFQTPCVGL